MTEQEKKGFLAALSSAGGFFGRVILPLGLFSVLAVGLHVGSDRIDDHLFVVVSWLDSLFDAGATAVIRLIGSLFSGSEHAIDVWTVRAIEWIDVDTKTELARIGALAVELFADFILALPVFFHRAQTVSPRQFVEHVKKTFRDPTLLKLVAPVSVLAAGTAGAFAVSRELQVLTHARLVAFNVESDVANFTASSMGFIALALVMWRVLLPLIVGAIEFADRRASNDTVLAVKPRARRFRGLFTAFVALPVAMIALFATPVLGTLRALLWL